MGTILFNIFKRNFSFRTKLIINIFLFMLLLLPQIAFSQNKKEFIREGNKLYNDGKFNDAEIQYRKSLEQEKGYNKGIFNLGDALYKQGQYDSAASKFSSIANQNLDEETRAKAFHNMGNALLKSKKYPESIQSYKNSLKLNPSDNDTKYNLEYAKKMLIQQQNQQKQNQQDKKDNQDKDKQKQDQQDKKNQDQDKDKKDQKDNQQQNEEQQDQKISKDDAKRILQALNNEEKNIQKKLKKKAKATKSKVLKQW